VIFATSDIPCVLEVSILIIEVELVIDASVVETDFEGAALEIDVLKTVIKVRCIVVLGACTSNVKVLVGVSFVGSTSGHAFKLHGSTEQQPLNLFDVHAYHWYPFPHSRVAR
jgi:hypothetical protein